MMEADSKSGRNGWNEDLIQKMMGLDDAVGSSRGSPNL